MARERERNYVRWIDGELFQERIALWDREEKEVDVDVVDEIEIKSFPYFLDFFSIESISLLHRRIQATSSSVIVALRHGSLLSSPRRNATMMVAASYFSITFTVLVHSIVSVSSFSSGRFVFFFFLSFHSFFLFASDRSLLLLLSSIVLEDPD